MPFNDKYFKSMILYVTSVFITVLRLVLMCFDKSNNIVIRRDSRIFAEEEYSYTLLIRRENEAGKYTFIIELRRSNGKKSVASSDIEYESTERAIRFYEKLLNINATPVDLCFVKDEQD